jgi:hypothetical protein
MTNMNSELCHKENWCTGYECYESNNNVEKKEIKKICKASGGCENKFCASCSQKRFCNNCDVCYWLYM